MHRGNVQQMLDILPPSFKAIFFNEVRDVGALCDWAPLTPARTV